MADYTLRQVNAKRAVNDYEGDGDWILVDTDDGGGAGSVTIEIPIEIPHYSLAQRHFVFDYYNVKILPMDASGLNVDWSVGTFVVDPASGYTTFTLFNHTTTQEPSQGPFAVIVDRVDRI